MIASAIQRGNSVYIYDENGRTTGVISVNGNDTLHGYTGNTVAIKRGNLVYIYDENGHTVRVLNG